MDDVRDILKAVLAMVLFEVIKEAVNYISSDKRK